MQQCTCETFCITTETYFLCIQDGSVYINQRDTPLHLKRHILIEWNIS